MAPRVKNSVQKVTKCHVLNRGSRLRNKISGRRIKYIFNIFEPFVLNFKTNRESPDSISLQKKDDLSHLF